MKDRAFFSAICLDCGWRSASMWEDAELPEVCCDCGGEDVSMEVRLLSEVGPCDALPEKRPKRSRRPASLPA